MDERAIKFFQENGWQALLLMAGYFVFQKDSLQGIGSWVGKTIHGMGSWAGRIAERLVEAHIRKMERTTALEEEVSRELRKSTQAEEDGPKPKISGDAGRSGSPHTGRGAGGQAERTLDGLRGTDTSRTTGRRSVRGTSPGTGSKN